MIPTDKKIVIFDGVCNLCDGTVQFIIERDKKDHFRFVPFQTEIGKKIAQQYQIDDDALESVVLVDEGKVYDKSSAVLRISKFLPYGWPLLYPLIIMPSFIRNGVYNWVASNRYKWYGKKSSCMMPTPDIKHKFLEL